MSPTVNTLQCQLIGKIFSNRDSTDEAIAAFRNLKIPPEDLAAIERFDDGEYQECRDAARRWLALWANRGASQTQLKVPLSKMIES